MKRVGGWALSGLTWASGVYIILVPSLSLLPFVGPFNEKRALQVSLLVIIGSVLILSQKHRRDWLSNLRRLPLSSRWGLGIVFSLGVASSTLAPSPFHAFLEMGHYLLLFILAGVIASVVRRAPERAEKMILGTVVVSAMMYAVYFSAGYAKYLIVSNANPWPDGPTNFANVRIFNQYQTLTLPLLASGALGYFGRWRFSKAAIFALVILWWALIFASDVRGTLLAMTTAAVGVGILFRSGAKKWILIQGVGLVLGLGLYYLLFSADSVPPVADRFTDVSHNSQRLQYWRTCLEMAWAHPFLGAGPMHFAWPPYHYATGASPHNAVMQWLGEWGIPSTIIMASLTIWGIWSWLLQERSIIECNGKTSSCIQVSFAAAVLAGVAHSMVSGLILAPLSQVLLALVGGWVWGRYQFSRNLSNDACSFRAHAIFCALLVSAVLVVGSSLRDLTTVTERRIAFMNSVERNTLSPRYWTQGYIGVRDSSVIEKARRSR
ncbi:O-antigen ligase family protein [Salinibacter grassmerensis]|uniref:O-antigen ligase family protein n=1 Tax=Salinibacter grassmerensis TaxID=3040353 RepID=UPI00311AAF87